jgi:formyltetrahydrofolate-dependent phosphoribosylglycinamide formyltransferase
LKHKELKIAVFVSGRGSNLQAVLDSGELKDLIKVKAVFSDKADCGAFDIAVKNSIETYCIGSKEGFISNDKLSEFLNQLGIDLIVLAGYLKLIPAEVIRSFEGKIINIHPALLPSFGGKGMYGMNVHKAVFNSSAKISGPTIHFVDNTYDTGKIIAQTCVDISDVNSPEEIAQRVLKSEHHLLPYVIKKIAEGKVKEINNRIIIND